MNLADVMAEVAEKLDIIVGLRVSPYRPDRITPPAAFPDLPERIDYDKTFRRGSDQVTLPVNVLVGKVSDRASHVAIAEYVAGSGQRSVKATLDSTDTNTYTSCDSVRVASVEFAIFAIGEVAYLAATFDVDIAGSGS